MLGGIYPTLEIILKRRDPTHALTLHLLIVGRNVSTLVQLHQQLWAYVMLKATRLCYILSCVWNLYWKRVDQLSSCYMLLTSRILLNFVFVSSQPTHMPEAFGQLHTLVVILHSKVCQLSFLTSGLEIEPCPALYEMWKSQQHW